MDRSTPAPQESAELDTHCLQYDVRFSSAPSDATLGPGLVHPFPGLPATESQQQHPASNGPGPSNQATSNLSGQPVGPEEKMKKPWKYYGYPAFTTWMASAVEFFPLRRFATINTRVILMMQYRISQLEIQLEQIDRVNRVQDGDINNGSFRWDKGTIREALLEELQRQCHRYSK